MESPIETIGGKLSPHYMWAGNLAFSLETLLFFSSAALAAFRNGGFCVRCLSSPFESVAFQQSSKKKGLIPLLQ